MAVLEIDLVVGLRHAGGLRLQSRDLVANGRHHACPEMTLEHQIAVLLVERRLVLAQRLTLVWCHLVHPVSPDFRRRYIVAPICQGTNS